MMKLSVIGAAGFLGTAIRQYSQDNNFNILSFGNRNNLHLQNEIFVEGDLINDFPFEKLLDQEMIFYCAGMGVQSGIEADKKKLYYINTYFPIALTEYLAVREARKQAWRTRLVDLRRRERELAHH